MKVASLFSGGKDSAFAAYVTIQHGWEVPYFVSVLSESDSSYMFHVPNVHLTSLQAEAAGAKYVEVKTKGEKEKELDDLKRALSKLEIDGVISGAVASEYQRTRIERICDELGIKSFAPLWHKDPRMLVRDMIEAQFDIRIVGAFAEGFDSSWLGKKLDMAAYEDLCRLNDRYGVSVSGEGGEYESLVLDCPMFGKRLEIVESQKEWKRSSGTLRIIDAKLVEK
ncbi:MAG: TIGR00289 family protein [Candidatus Thermoplasmatota archaeon]|nr:TIGR00289 family protein [Candidatus Thermoplasmatota archaeon]